MMKKILVVLLAAVCVFSLAACSSSGTKLTSEKAEQISNPWTEYNTKEEMEADAGFTIQLPDMSAITSEEPVYRCAKELEMIEVLYPGSESDNYIRKAKQTEDISGDYNEYPYTNDLEGVILKGSSEEEVVLATWKDGDFSYAIGLEKPVRSVELLKLVSEVK